ncbi:MAG: AAA family ATPase, partial [Thermoanaerobaculia bacterium]|nr:AAA family ATPase [Thermoanaerobaculia bacterium]
MKNPPGAAQAESESAGYGVTDAESAETPGPTAPPLGAPTIAADEAIRVQAIAARIRLEIAKAVVAQDDAIEHLLIALLAAGHVLLEGVPGTGKTLMVLALSRTFGGRFGRIQFTPDLMPTDVTGHTLYDAESGKFQIRKGPAFTNMLLADEINRA